VHRSHAPPKPSGGRAGSQTRLELLGEKQLEELDLFDRAQLAFVVDVCKRSRSLSEAGGALFGASRTRKAFSNDADRLRKYLARFGVEFSRIQGNLYRQTDR
jgi:transcriptional regulatory protein RtcR